MISLQRHSSHLSNFILHLTHLFLSFFNVSILICSTMLSQFFCLLSQILLFFSREFRIFYLNILNGHLNLFRVSDSSLSNMVHLSWHDLCLNCFLSCLDHCFGYSWLLRAFSSLDRWSLGSRLLFGAWFGRIQTTWDFVNSLLILLVRWFGLFRECGKRDGFKLLGKLFDLFLDILLECLLF
jgi:hypothetical protein